MVLLKENVVLIESNLVILAGLGSSISMLISGLTGSYLSERAEQKKIKDTIKKSMILSEESDFKDFNSKKIPDNLLRLKRNGIENEVVLKMKRSR